MILGILRYLRGWVRFSIIGKYPERFINIALKRRLRLWGVERKDIGMTACMHQRDYLHIRALARASGVRLRVKERHGLPTCLKQYSDRAGLAVGAAAFVLTVFVMSLFIWNVEITGLEHISECEMRELLRENGVSVGAFRPAVDDQRASRGILLSDGRVGWMAINLRGSCASVEIKEESPSPEITDVDTPCEVRARRDGRILKINARQGLSVPKVGSGVVEGQLLVSGVMEDALGGSRQVHAEAEVIAETQYTAAFSIPRRITVHIPAGEVKQRLTADLFGLRLPLNITGVSTLEYLCGEREESPAPLDVRLPVGLIKRDIFAMEQQEIQLDDNSAKELLTREAQLYEVFTLSACTVTERSYHLSETSDGYILTVGYTCAEDIAVTVPIREKVITESPENPQ